MSTATSRGCAAHSVAASRPSRAAAPCARFCTNTSASATSRRTTSCPRGSFRSSAIDILAAVAPHEVRGQAAGGGVVATREVTAVDPLDLDHPGAEVGELTGGERGRDGLFDGDDGDALQGQGDARWGGSWLAPRSFVSRAGLLRRYRIPCAYRRTAAGAKTATSSAHHASDPATGGAGSRRGGEACPSGSEQGQLAFRAFLPRVQDRGRAAGLLRYGKDARLSQLRRRDGRRGRELFPPRAQFRDQGQDRDQLQ
ncbi:hypothetical protein SGLAM104S_05681 [Streptomyces glaucescens]